jgi:hypothetical protein
MVVSKAEAQPPDKASTTGFSFVVPCVSEIDAARIRDYLARDDFVWLDLTAPSKEDVDKLHELFGFHPVALVVVGASLIEAARSAASGGSKDGAPSTTPWLGAAPAVSLMRSSQADHGPRAAAGGRERYGLAPMTSMRRPRDRL